VSNAGAAAAQNAQQRSLAAPEPDESSAGSSGPPPAPWQITPASNGLADITAARALARPETRACSTMSMTATAISGRRQYRSWFRKPGVMRTQSPERRYENAVMEPLAPEPSML